MLLRDNGRGKRNKWGHCLNYKDTLYKLKYICVGLSPFRAGIFVEFETKFQTAYTGCQASKLSETTETIQIFGHGRDIISWCINRTLEDMVPMIH